MSKDEFLSRASRARRLAAAVAIGALGAAALVFHACTAPPPPPPPPPPPTPVPTAFVPTPLVEPPDLTRDLLAEVGFTVTEENRDAGTIVAELRRSVTTVDEERAALAELRRIARFDEELGTERIAGYEIRVEIRIEQSDSAELDVAAKAEIRATPRARVAALPPPPSRQLVSRGVLERDLIERIHARWSE